MSTRSVMKPLSIGMLLVGCFWIVILAWIYLSLGSLSVPVSGTVVAVEYGCMALPPLLMIIGAVMVLKGSAVRTAAILICLTSLFLTGLLGLQLAPEIHPVPLQAEPPYVLYGCLMLVVLLIDFGAIWLYQLASRRSEPSAGSGVA